METKLKIEDIKPYEFNVKIHDEEQIEALFRIVKEVGWRQAVLVNQKGVIVVGHGRMLTWERHKGELKPIWIIDDAGNTIHGEPETTPMTPEQETEYRLADNKLNESPWDLKILANFSEDALLNAGWKPEELDSIFNLDSGEDAFQLEAELEKIAEPKVKLGDLYILGGEVVCPKCNKIHKL